MCAGELCQLQQHGQHEQCCGGEARNGVIIGYVLKPITSLTLTLLGFPLKEEQALAAP